jgi:hypothetical protein
MTWLLPEDPSTYDISFDSAPSFYLNGRQSALDSTGKVVINPTLRASSARRRTRKRLIRLSIRRI